MKKHKSSKFKDSTIQQFKDIEISIKNHANFLNS